jgi:hypothetical protein
MLVPGNHLAKSVNKLHRACEIVITGELLARRLDVHRIG